MSVENQKRVLALLLGLVTIGAAVFTWRAGQIASGAAYDDRQAVGQTIKQEQQNLELALVTMNQAVGYVRYVLDYGEAAALDAEAAEFDAVGDTEYAEARREAADDLRRAATERAGALQIFGRSALASDVLAPSEAPRDFDFVSQFQLAKQEANTSIRSPGVLTPDAFATEANEKRTQVRGLHVSALVMVLAIAALTVAQVARSTTGRLLSGAIGTLIALVTTIITFNTVW